MGTWTLFHMRSPLNSSPGDTGMIGELTMASSRSLKFSLDDHDTLSFSLPGRHVQASDITPLVSDVMVFRDTVPVQRFRVVSRQITWGTTVQVTFSCVSYKALLKAWIFHEDVSDKKRWPASDGAVNSADVAWSIFNLGQSFSKATLGCGRGHVPSSAITLAAGMLVSGDDGSGDFFAAGSDRRAAIDTLSKLGAGFEWDLSPGSDPFDPYTQLEFNVWSLAEHGRHQHYTGTSFEYPEFILDDGGNVLGGTHNTDPSEFANVGRFQVEGADTATIAPVWVPSDKNPVGPAFEGRWERDFSSEKFGTAAAAASGGANVLAKARDYLPVISASLRRGRWNGPPDLWLGDYTRFVLTIPVDGVPDTYSVYIDEEVRVVEVTVQVDDLGAEDVNLSLDRPNYSTHRDVASIYDRLAHLERR